MHIVRSGAADKFDSLVSELGQNPVEIMAAVGLSAAQFRDPDTYLAYPRLAELLEEAAARCQQPLFGALLAERQNLQSLGDLPMLVSRAETVGDALARVNDFLYLHSSGVTLNMTPQDDWVRLSLSIDVHSERGIAQLMQLSVSHLAMFIASLLDIEANHFSLHLTQHARFEAEQGEFAQQNKLRFGDKFDGILLKASLLNAKNHQDEDALERHFQQHLKELQTRYPNNLSDQAANMIGRLLSTGECSVERVARALDLHPRMLQSKLKQQGTSYRQLLQQVRQDFAEQRLSENIQSITDIALQLGYAETAVFSRHFRRWTGKSPRQWRLDKMAAR
ncbi:TPA: AraC family transcriptional regulator ligand-binding domain-containing protein [Vibrio parahaemolyticus]|uniref:AraC family transcriptional regulator ligand-binding domain-containing protein n=1 Tax=Vibrio parahaemolyticus TaxID=670 RepID=A0AA47L8T5_VIBPH|nr:AraC family transcriptional regulator [Vibrio parahaemolyticus]MEA5347622.1 AraC family transcriptional regulator ligand-binding domain-containing protein [Vibrio parahaemolyticus]ODY73852.1 transcriptional regulator [Vibrio parahaemolyticus]TOP06003.1 AraC family transcriptional regulator [Vibrio parahaemolyticus]TOP16532.1 AraC family transcriptional regulator [Vibrio parahaemolyticus]WAT92561.1 AraC family transcriptional regulator ligand-binding domain-containing protein [Vibrio parahae